MRADTENRNLPAFTGAGYDGLTKREYIATEIMGKLCSMPVPNSGYYSGQSPEEVAKRAVIFADALLKELTK